MPCAKALSVEECKERQREAGRRYRKANQEKERERSKHRREANPDKAREAVRRSREKHRETTREADRLRARRNRENNPDKIREFNRNYARRKRQEDPEKVREALRRWQRANPEKRAATDAHRRVRIKVHMSSMDIRWSTRWRIVIREDPCFYCGALSDHDDHYLSLAHNGTDHWYNLVRACATCNLSKHAKCGDCFIAGTSCSHYGYEDTPPIHLREKV